MNDLRNDTNFLHVHYTGGTKVMGVETVAALEASEASLPQDIHLDTSYLDARAKSGPAIVNSAGKNWVDDARKGIDPDLCQIARLNGFVVGPFEYQGKKGVSNYSEPKHPTQDELNQGKNYLLNVSQSNASDRMLEWGAYFALQKALKKIKKQERRNYALFQKVYVRRAKDKTSRPFELDVVAVLGYQVVVISCTTTARGEKIKLKAIEAYHRAKQLGGDEAHAVMLCGSNIQGDDKEIEEGLVDEIGSADRHLQVWGKDEWRDLSRKFERYLRNDLKWR